MALIIELDSNWCGIGIDWKQTVKGIRLGYFAVHVLSYDRFQQLTRRGLLN